MGVVAGAAPSLPTDWEREGAPLQFAPASQFCLASAAVSARL
jgi:hypothetical protein